MALWSACREGGLLKVRQLIKEGHDVNTRGGYYGTTPLIEATIKGHDQVVEELVSPLESTSPLTLCCVSQPMFIP